MDLEWDDNYAPSECAKHPRWNTNSDKPLSVQVSRLQKNTRALKVIPYEPGTWLLRAQLLLSLGYPELAAGDAYKARLLVEASHDVASCLGLQVRLQYGMCLWLGWHERWDPNLGGLDAQTVSESNIAEELVSGLQGFEQQAWFILIIALQHIDCLLENQSLAKQAEDKFGESLPDDTGPWSKNFQESLNHLLQAKQKACESFEELSHDTFLVKKAMLNGNIVMRQYPWMYSFTKRTEDTAWEISTDFKSPDLSYCVARESHIEGANFGVFATQAITKDATFLTDKSYTAATSISGRCPTFQCPLPSAAVLCENCGEKFCSIECRATAQGKFHQPLCGKTLEYPEFDAAGLIKHTARNPLSETLLLQRFLAIIVQAVGVKKGHPLKVPTMNRLTANYAGNTTVPWNFLQALVLPIRILQTLNVDIFADHRFDTWVIQTIMFRINNNSAMGWLDGHRGSEAPFVKGVYLRHALFNHSCEPNVSYNDHPSLAAQVLRAKRNISAGEELYIAYDLGLDATGMDVWKRREAVSNWMGGDCKCSRCLRETEEMGDLVDPFNT